MTLRERFSQKLPWYSKKDNLKKSEECEKIADDYAIDFMEWCQYEMPMEYFTYHTSKALLEIFKKEKGL